MSTNKLIILVGFGINTAGCSLTEFTATTIGYETLYDSKRISQPSLFILWAQEKIDPEIILFILIILSFDKISTA